MKRSETIGELAKALAAAQAEYPPIPKSHTGKIQGEGKRGAYEYSYKYADLADTTDACRPINAKHGLAVSQAPETIDGEDYLTTTLMHESGEWQESSRSLRAAKSDPQGTGSAITYARRYDYCAVLGIVADEDDDGARAQRGAAPARASSTRRATSQQAPRPDVDPETGEIESRPGPKADQGPSPEGAASSPVGSPTDVESMKPRDLNAALARAGLPTGGTVPQMRERLAAHVNGTSDGAVAVAERGERDVEPCFLTKGCALENGHEGPCDADF